MIGAKAVGSVPRVAHRAIASIGLLTLVVVALAWPVQAQAARFGGGASAGTLSYGTTRVPAALATTCAPTSFNLDGASQGFVLHTALAGYVGPVTFDGTGSASCEALSGGGGPITLTLTGTGPFESTLECTLSGGWTRLGSDLGATVGGDCLINGAFTTSVNVTLRAAWVPSPVGVGVTSPIDSATYQGTFALAPT